MCQRLGWLIKIREGLPKLSHRHRTLCAHHPSADDSGNNHYAKCWPKANGIAHLDEQGNLDQGDGYEGQKQPHCENSVFMMACKVDLTAPVTYISASNARYHAPHDKRCP